MDSSTLSARGKRVCIAATNMLTLRLACCRGAKDLDSKYKDKQKEEEKKIKETAKAMKSTLR